MWQKHSNASKQGNKNHPYLDGVYHPFNYGEIGGCLKYVFTNMTGARFHKTCTVVAMSPQDPKQLLTFNICDIGVKCLVVNLG